MESLPQASASLPWSVHKIGGTSIARYLDHIVDNIVAPRATSERLVIVCSARSLASKAKGTTSTLLEAAEKAAESRGTSQRRASDARGRDQRWRLDCFAQADPAPLRSPLLSPLQNPSGVPLDRVTSALLDRARERSTSASTRASSASTRTSSTLSSMRNSLIDFADIQESPPSSRASVDERFDPRTAEEFGWLSDIQALQEDHFAAVRTHCQDASIAEKCLSDLSCDFDELYAVLAAVETLGFLSAQMKERIVAFGELWSTRVLTAALCSKHLDASVVRLDSLALDWDTCSADQVEERVVRAIRDELAHNSSRVLVVPGYYGPLPYALLETVGRGYSDRCASLCADALSVSCMFIWKEVAGILQANPNVAADAKVISAITRREAHELAKYGNEVINAEALKVDKSVRIKVQHVLFPEDPGTVIDGVTDEAALSSGHASRFSLSLLPNVHLITHALGSPAAVALAAEVSRGDFARAIATQSDGEAMTVWLQANPAELTRLTQAAASSKVELVRDEAVTLLALTGSRDDATAKLCVALPAIQPPPLSISMCAFPLTTLFAVRSCNAEENVRRVHAALASGGF